MLADKETDTRSEDSSLMSEVPKNRGMEWGYLGGVLGGSAWAIGAQGIAFWRFGISTETSLALLMLLVMLGGFVWGWKEAIKGGRLSFLGPLFLLAILPAGNAFALFLDRAGYQMGDPADFVNVNIMWVATGIVLYFSMRRVEQRNQPEEGSL